MTLKLGVYSSAVEYMLSLWDIWVPPWAPIKNKQMNK